MNIAERFREVDELRKRVKGIDKDGWDHIKQVTRLLHFPKDHLFIEPRLPCTKMGYVVRGIVMSFEYDIDDEKNVSQIYMNNLNPGVCDFKNFKSDRNTSLSFITLQPTTILCIDKPAYLNLYSAVNNIEAISYSILYDCMVDMTQYHVDKKNCNKEAFVLWFYNKYPILFDTTICERRFLTSYLGLGKDFISKTLAKHGIII